MRLNYVSPSVERLRGLTVEEALAEPIDESFTPESLARVGEIMARSTGPGGFSSYTGVFDQPCADGSLKHVEITASYLRDEAGRPVEILGVSRDATARVDAERALEQREREMRTILQTALDGFGSIDVAGRFREVNEALGAITGYSREELLGMRVADLEQANGDGEVAAAWRASAASGPARFETRYRRKDGRIIDVEVSARFSDDAGGSIPRLLPGRDRPAPLRGRAPGERSPLPHPHRALDRHDRAARRGGAHHLLEPQRHRGPGMGGGRGAGEGTSSTWLTPTIGRARPRS